jgi:pyruvate kinase
VCTLGPATTSLDAIAALVDAGMDVARLNMSHGDHDDHQVRFEAVREASAKAGRPVAIMADLCGPKIRVDAGFEPRDVAVGDEVLLTEPDAGIEGAVEVTLEGLATAAEPGQPILIEDGRIRLEVVDVRDGIVRTEVVVGGTIKPGKGVNLPRTKLTMPALTPKDEEDLRFAAGIGVDYVAMSFVRSVSDVVRVQEALEEAGSSARVISKIEKAEAIEDLDAIVKASDGVMVARGDLGVEVSFAEVPLLQKRIIASARAHGRCVITATQMLESMITSPVPTRAEASDIANAILDGTSAVMLSAETASGGYPAEAVRVMDEVARLVEPTLSFDMPGDPAPPERIVTGAACAMAERLDAALVAVRTGTGASARDASRYRPLRPILAATTSPEVQRSLAMEYAVVPILVQPASTLEEAWSAILEEAQDLQLATTGDVVVLTGATELSVPGPTTGVAVHRIEPATAADERARPV